MTLQVVRPRRFALILVGVGSAAALGVAFVYQYVLGHPPCHLCLLERYPYVLALLAGFFGIVTGWVRPALLASVLVLAVNVGLSAYHVGVEEGVFALPGSCVAGTMAGTVDELRAQLATALPTCDQAVNALFGLSLAAWNGVAALVLALIAMTGFLAPRERFRPFAARA